MQGTKHEGGYPEEKLLRKGDSEIWSSHLHDVPRDLTELEVRNPS